MNKAGKIILVIMAGVGILFVGIVIAIFSMLPSPGQMSRKVFRQKTPATVAESTAVPSVNAPDTTAPAAAAPSEKIEPTAAQSKFTLDPEKHQAILDSLMNPEVPLTEFCSHMNLPSKAAGITSYEEFGRTFRDHFMKDGGQDMMMDSLLPLFRTMLRYPELTGMIELVRNSQNPEEDGIMKKAEFYTLVAGAYRRINSQRPVLEGLMDRSYHFFMLARAIQKKPELAKDPAVMDYCKQIESATNESQPYGGEEERVAFTEFLKQSGVSAADIGYDPSYKTNFTVKSSGLNVHLQGGWMENWMKVPAPGAANSN